MFFLKTFVEISPNEKSRQRILNRQLFGLLIQYVVLDRYRDLLGKDLGKFDVFILEFVIFAF